MYTIEAHPNSSADPGTYEERAELAAACTREDNISVPVLVDEMDNAVWCSYGARPNNAYFIGVDGRIVKKQDWYRTQEMEKAIEDYLDTLG